MLVYTIAYGKPIRRARPAHIWALGQKQTSTVRMRQAQLVPTRLKELAHAMARLPYGRIVLVERLAIVEDLTNVDAKLFLGLVC